MIIIIENTYGLLMVRPWAEIPERMARAAAKAIDFIVEQRVKVLQK